MTFLDTLQLKVVKESPTHVEMTMPITPEVRQPFGFLHGGATIALLESVASRGSEVRADLEKNRPFGIDVHVRHWLAGREGMVHAVADFDHEEPSKVSGMKHYWNVAAYDDEGNLLSKGEVMVKIVPLSRLEEKKAEMAAKRTASAAASTAADVAAGAAPEKVPEKIPAKAPEK